MKKIISLILALAMLLSLGLTASAEGNAIAKDSSWKITATDNYPGGLPTLAFDGNEKTMYHSFYQVNPDGTMNYERNGHAITVDFGKTINVSGFTYQARKDNKSGVMTAFEIYSSDDGVNFKEIYKGTFNYGEDYSDTSVKSASWGDTNMRAIKLVSTEGYAGHFTAPEITFLQGTSGTKNGSGKIYVAKETEKAEEASKINSVSLDEVGGSIITKEASWVITASDNVASMGPALAFDGNEKTMYHSFYEVTESGMQWQRNNHAITVDFGERIKVSGWIYQRRTNDKSGVISGYEIHTSENGTDFEKIYTGAFDYRSDYSDMSAKIGSWGDVETRYIKILSTEGYAGHATAAEISFLTGSKRIEEDAAQNQKSEEFYTAKNGVKSISRKGWKLSVNSELNSNTIGNISDGDTKTHWHSWYAASGTTITKKDGLPYEIEVVLPELETISGVIFIPRQDNQSGRFISTNVYVSESDDGEYFLLTEGYETETNPSVNELLYNSNIKVKKVKIEVVASYGTYGTLAELYLLGENKEKETVTFDAFAENEKKNKLYPIQKSEMRVFSETPVWGEHVIGCVIDSSRESFWQTEAVTKGTSISLKVDLGRVNKFSEISYLPRQTEDHHGLWKNVNIWISEDGEDWTAALENVTVEQSLGEHYFKMPEAVTARYIEFEITDFEAGRASCADISIWQDYESLLEYGQEKEKYTLKINSNIIGVEKGKKAYEKQLDVAPYIVNGSTLIPLRGLLEEMGATISWDGETQTVTIEKGIQKIYLQIWSKMVYADTSAYGKVRHTMLNFPVIKDSRTFIPIRFISEQLGYNVSWDGETQTVTITTPEI